MTTIDVFSRDGETKYVIPREDVHHLPQGQQQQPAPKKRGGKGEANRLILCERYDPAAPEESCPFAKTMNCRFVHADLRRAQATKIHVNFAYRTLDECRYERHPPGKMFAVYLPNTAGNPQCCVVIPSEHALVTRCIYSEADSNPQQQRQHGKKLAAHCAHFFYGRECHLGANCNFAHVLTVDPTARPGKRVAAGTRPNKSMASSEKQTPRKAADEAPSRLEFSPSDSTRDCREPSYSCDNLPVDDHSLCGTLSVHQRSGADSPCQDCRGVSHTSTSESADVPSWAVHYATLPARRYRNDPYSAHGFVLVH